MRSPRPMHPNLPPRNEQIKANRRFRGGDALPVRTCVIERCFKPDTRNAASSLLAINVCLVRKYRVICIENDAKSSAVSCSLVKIVPWVRIFVGIPGEK